MLRASSSFEWIKQSAKSAALSAEELYDADWTMDADGEEEELKTEGRPLLRPTGPGRPGGTRKGPAKDKEDIRQPARGCSAFAWGVTYGILRCSCPRRKQSAQGYEMCRKGHEDDDEV